VRLKNEDSNTLSFFDEPKDEMAAIKTKYFYSVSPKEKKSLQSQYKEFIKRHTDVVSDRVQQLLSYHPFNSDTPAEFFDKFEMYYKTIINSPQIFRQ
jgi:pantothenate kinase type III